jgi:hypothetical protein
LSGDRLLDAPRDPVGLLHETIVFLLLRHIATGGGLTKLGYALVKLRELCLKLGLVIHILPVYQLTEY